MRLFGGLTQGVRFFALRNRFGRVLRMQTMALIWWRSYGANGRFWDGQGLMSANSDAEVYGNIFMFNQSVCKVDLLTTNVM